jgi:rhamnosyltransferase
MKSPLSLAHRVCAVVVSYNPHLTFLANMAALSPQVNHVVVVDNGSRGEAEEYLRTLEARPGYTVIRNHQNLGIAVALNLGVKYALEEGFDWIATFDQDSQVSDGFIVLMLETYEQAPHPEAIAIIAPNCVDRDSGCCLKALRAGNGKVLTAMTSGSMMPSRAIQMLGPFDASLFMDYVDIEFCLRARHKGMLIFQSPAILSHALGRITHHRILGIVCKTTNHSAARRYYITRNRLRLLIEYAADWPWAWRESRAILFETAKVALIEDHKREKFCSMIWGAVDALRGKVGKQIEL